VSEGSTRSALLASRPFHFRIAVIGEDDRGHDEQGIHTRPIQVLMGVVAQSLRILVFLRFASRAEYCVHL